MGNDHVPFVCAGIPGITVNRGGGHTAFMHTPEDALDLISEKPLEEIGRLLDTFIYRTAASGHVWPFERQVPEKPQKDLGKIMEKLIALIEND